MLKSWYSSWRHCPSSGLGVISRIRRAPSARSWAMTRPASMVFPRPDLVGEDAAALPQAGEGEDDRIHLVRVGVDLRRTLGGGVTALLIRAPQAHEFLRQEAALRGVKEHWPSHEFIGVCRPINRSTTTNASLRNCKAVWLAGSAGPALVTSTPASPAAPTAS